MHLFLTVCFLLLPPPPPPSLHLSHHIRSPFSNFLVFPFTRFFFCDSLLTRYKLLNKSYSLLQRFFLFYFLSHNRAAELLYDLPFHLKHTRELGHFRGEKENVCWGEDPNSRLSYSTVLILCVCVCLCVGVLIGWWNFTDVLKMFLSCYLH